MSPLQPPGRNGITRSQYLVHHICVNIIEFFTYARVHEGMQRTRSLYVCLASFPRIHFRPQVNGEELEEREFVRSYAHRNWCSTWCNMLRHNIFACARDTREGIRRPHVPTAARTGPFPPLDPCSRLGADTSNRPSDNALGTVHTPVMVLSDRLKVAGSMAGSWVGVPTPAKHRGPMHGGDLSSAADSHGDRIAVPSEASGRELMHQDIHSGERDINRPYALSSSTLAVPRAGSDDGTIETDSSSHQASPTFTSHSNLGSIESGKALMSDASAGHGVGGPVEDDSRSYNASMFAGSSLTSVASGPSGRGLMTGAITKSHGSDLVGNISPSHHGSVMTSCSDIGTVESGPSGWGLITADALLKNRDSDAAFSSRFSAFGVRKSGLSEDDIPRRRNSSVVTSSRDVASAQGRGVSVGRKLIQLGGSNERGLNSPTLPMAGEEDTNEDLSEVARVSESGKPSYGFLFSSRAPIVSDMPRRNSSYSGVCVDSAAGSIYSLNAPRDLDGEVDHAVKNPEGQRISRDGEGRKLGVDSRVLWGSRAPTATDLPRRRSIQAFAWDARGDPDQEGVEEERGQETEPGTSRLQTRQHESSRTTGGNNATLDASWKRAPSAVDFPRRGYFSGSRRGSVSGSASSSGRSHAGETEVFHHGKERKEAIGGDEGEAVNRRDDGSGEVHVARDASGRRNKLAFGGLVGLKREPIPSDLPRRLSRQYNLPEDGVGRATEGATGGSTDSGGRGGQDSEKDTEEMTNSRSASHSHSRRSSSVGESGRRWSVRSVEPIAVDLPQRTSGYSSSASESRQSLAGCDVAVGKALRCHEEVKGEGDAESVDCDDAGRASVRNEGYARGEDRGRSSGHNRGKMLFRGRVGGKHDPVQVDVPRRRSSQFSLPDHETGCSADDAGGIGSDVMLGKNHPSGEKKDAEEITDLGSANPRSPRTSTGRGGRGRGRWGLKRRGPYATDFPRHALGFSPCRPLPGVAIAASPRLGGGESEGFGYDGDVSFRGDRDSSGVGVDVSNSDSSSEISLQPFATRLGRVGHNKYGEPVQNDIPRGCPSETSLPVSGMGSSAGNLSWYDECDDMKSHIEDTGEEKF